MNLRPDLGQVKDKAGCQISRMVVYIVRRRDFDDIKANQLAWSGDVLKDQNSQIGIHTERLNDTDTRSRTDSKAVNVNGQIDLFLVS